MADVDLNDLKAALRAEGLEVDNKVMDRVFRRLTMPEGCEHCGQHVKVGVVKRGKIYTACCGTLVSASKEK